MIKEYRIFYLLSKFTLSRKLSFWPVPPMQMDLQECRHALVQCSGVASPKIWGAKMFDFRRTTLFCLEKRLSKHEMTIFSKNWGGGMAS